jgi:hypothetical protein
MTGWMSDKGRVLEQPTDGSNDRRLAFCQQISKASPLLKWYSSDEIWNGGDVASGNSGAAVRRLL